MSDLLSENVASGPADEAALVAASASMSRDDIRTLIFNTKAKRHQFTAFGAPIDLVEPALEEVLDFQADEDKKNVTAQMLVRYVYMRDSDVKVFDAADVASLLSLPFNADMQALLKKINEILEVSPSDDDKSEASTESE
jgi:hypothetical protein